MTYRRSRPSGLTAANLATRGHLETKAARTDQRIDKFAHAVAFEVCGNGASSGPLNMSQFN